jgi:anthraniloyl-CoA monooxygenase
MDPMPFAFNLLTRSGRITHANLAQRDPQFVRVLDASFHGGVESAVAPPPLFAPWHGLRNRIVRATAAPEEAAGLARSGAGMVLVGPVAATADGRISPGTPTVHDEGWAELVEEVHAGGAQAGVLLTHAGRRGSTRPRARDLPLREGGWPLVAPSPIAYAPRMPVPTALDADAMTSVRDGFVEAARRAAGAGFDVLELDMGHGYLLASFLSPESNRRDDEYGEDRMRFPLEVLDAVRAEWPGLLAVRLNVLDGTRNGLQLREGIAIARELAEHGCGLVHVVAGQTVPEAPQAEYRRGFLTPLADRVRAEARVPTLVGGYLTTPDEANTIIGAGRADLCLLDVPETDLERQVLESSEPVAAVAV